MIVKRQYRLFSSAGFTLIELIIVIVVLGIMAAYATFNASPSELSLPSQAQTMASNIRHLQTVANTGKRTRLSVVSGTNGSYTGVTCTNTNDSCAAIAPIFSVTLEKSVDLGGTSDILYFDTLGRPSSSVEGNTATSASYTISHSGSSKTVAVATLTGFVTVSP